MLLSCDMTTDLSISNCSGHDIEIVIVANHKFTNAKNKWSNVASNRFSSSTLKYNDKIKFENIIINEIHDDYPFDSIIIYKHNDTLRLDSKLLYPNYFDTDVLGGISTPYLICIY